MGATAKNVDFTNVKEGGGFNKKRIPAGDYLATITKVEDAEAKSDKVPQFLFSIKIAKHPSSVLPYYCKLTENQLWKLRNILIAAGKTVPKKRFKVDPNSIVNKQIGVTIEDTEYEGKDQSEIAGVFPAAELGELPADVDEDEDDEEEAEEEADADTEDEPEEEEAGVEVWPEEIEEEAEEEGDEFDAMDRLELRKALLKFKVQTSKTQSDDDLRDLLREKNKPAPKAKATAKKPAAKKSITDVSDDELEELDIDDI